MSAKFHPHRPGRNQPSRRSARAFPESKNPQRGKPSRRSRLAAVVLGRVQRSRRNAVAAVGVRLGEAPDAPSWGKVCIRTPSGLSCGYRLSDSRYGERRQRVALGDTHPSGDAQTLHAPSSRHGWFVHAAISRMRTATGMAGCTTTGLTDQVGSDNGSRAATYAGRSCLDDPASWKDPL